MLMSLPRMAPGSPTTSSGRISTSWKRMVLETVPRMPMVSQSWTISTPGWSARMSTLRRPSVMSSAPSSRLQVK